MFIVVLHSEAWDIEVHKLDAKNEEEAEVLIKEICKSNFEEDGGTYYEGVLVSTTEAAKAVNLEKINNKMREEREREIQKEKEEDRSVKEKAEYERLKKKYENGR